MIKMSSIGNHITNSLPLKEGLGIGLLALSLALTGCQKDDFDEPSVEYRTVQLITGMNDLKDGGELTRALPSGYSEYSPTSDPGQIGLFMTQNQAGKSSYTYTALTGTFTWQSSTTWASSIAVLYDKDATGDENQYYAYGFMPAESGINAEITSTDFAVKATMTLENVPPVSAKDFCVVTGIKTGTPIAPGVTPYTYPSIEDVGLVEGEYTFTADTLSNAIYLLLKHVYSKYSVKMRVDSTYNSMRTIKITDMKLSASAPAMKVVVEYTKGTAPDVSVSALSSTSELTTDVLDTETALTPTTINLTDFYCADLLSYITLETTFDVYDKSGNKLRSKCTAKNKITVQKLEAGNHYTITATIKPTYLYQLSDDDLNNPSVVID